MRILIAPDKFKDSLSSVEVCSAIEEGIRLFNSAFSVICFPMADGGDGTALLLTRHSNGKTVSLNVHDPLMRLIKSSYGISKDGKTAFMEMAAASGIELLHEKERNCLHTSSYGTGELIADAVNRGVDTIIMGIGGSATNDGGMGMAAALGYQFIDENGKSLEPVGKNLIHVKEIKDLKNISSLLKKIKIRVACDVENPLFGKNGAAYVYGPQKGADENAVKFLDKGLRNFAIALQKFSGTDVSNIPGSGAAGGMGAGIMALLNGELVPGVNLVIEQTEFEKQLRNVDLIITGEGKMDEQTLNGKVVYGICQLAKAYSIPVAALTGSLNLTPQQLKVLALNYASSIVPGPVDLSYSLQNAYELIKNASWNIISLFATAKENNKK